MSLFHIVSCLLCALQTARGNFSTFLKGFPSSASRETSSHQFYSVALLGSIFVRLLLKIRRLAINACASMRWRGIVVKDRALDRLHTAREAIIAHCRPPFIHELVVEIPQEAPRASKTPRYRAT